MTNIIDLHNELSSKTYRHSDYHAFNISDPKPRNIHKAKIRDRLLHHALYHELYSFLTEHLSLILILADGGKGHTKQYKG